jgi:hypothetical protein
MNTTSHTRTARMTGIDFHDVYAEHVTTEVNIFSDFCTVRINISGQNITLFTKDRFEAYAILRNITNYDVRPTDEVDITDIYQDEEPF